MKIVAKYRNLKDHEVERIKACLEPKHVEVTEIGRDIILSATSDNMNEIIRIMRIFDRYWYREMELQR